MGQLTPAQDAGGLRRLVGICAPARVALAVLLITSLTVAISACGREKRAGLGERVIPLGQPVPKGGGRYHVGEPYEIDGERYRPREQPNYDRVGQASWYGELFHGRYTANGEIYDMDRLSAAHPTLPLPVYAQVTNLNNGRSIIVRINDRGPFRKGRIIDLSRRSAEVLGFRGRGTAPVRVRFLKRAPLSGDDSYERQYLANAGYRGFASKSKPAQSDQNPIALASLPGNDAPPLPERVERKTTTAVLALPPAPAEDAADGSLTLGWAADINNIEASPEPTGSTGPAAKVIERPALPGRFALIQAGSFKSKDNAERARKTLSAFAPVDVAEVDVGGETYFRVRLGPFPDALEAAVALPKVRAAGYDSAKILTRN